jgi:phosphate starvation-inducible PhoH-like protein
MPRHREVQIDRFINFQPHNKTQELAIQCFNENDLVFFTGPAGSGKTHVAAYCALRELEQNSKTKRKVIITRPIVEAGEKLGFLPGELASKVAPYFSPIYECANKIVRDEKFLSEHFKILPLAYMRGVSFENCVAILDEAQNCTISQIELYLTRLGRGGKILVSGDISQSDIYKSGLLPWVNALRGKPGIGFIEFDESDIVRHELVRTIIANRPR